MQSTFGVWRLHYPRGMSRSTGLSAVDPAAVRRYDGAAVISLAVSIIAAVSYGIPLISGLLAAAAVVGAFVSRRRLRADPELLGAGAGVAAVIVGGGVLLMLLVRFGVPLILPALAFGTD